MASCSGNIDVVINVGDRPSCPHGPALLFTKYIQGSKDNKTVGCQRRFFACSAFRDRKACPFFQWEDEKLSAEKMRIREEINRQNAPPFTHKQYWKRFLQLQDLSKDDHSYCHTCGLLLLPEERASHRSSGHNITSPVTRQMLHRPSQLFVPLDDNKTYAQYLFAESTVEFLLKTLQAHKFTHILCVGCPRIHESIQIRCSTDMEPTGGLNSLLLDLDHRFFQVYPPSLFCQYNMFNHHFFDGKSSEKVFRKFLTEDNGMNVAIVMDPPFGGMVEALAATVKKIEHTWQITSNKPSLCRLPVFLFFPYFMEKRILDCVPEFCMLDYKVDYDNHLLFTGAKGKKKGSPVRIFCNLSPKMVKLPKKEGYWYCHKCNRYSAKENRHCDICETCTSKDGTTYVHCDRCGRCVKPSRVHCDICNTCEIPKHICGAVRSEGCHICGSLEHKRRECPNKHQQQCEKFRGIKRKRKRDKSQKKSRKH
ncbi:hypothetical protein CHS0354_038289 [Potamilus streckersoni]|uniref:Zinc finger CCHC domain-containing protein 4 n=1 Tax=Potamilus streckersoni TaxID=2493646 RepID=A0AAE0WC19_9BIVA|nr:hypothetical protein CHS0354_038289 [Potamilus streckersoni]